MTCMGDLGAKIYLVSLLQPPWFAPPLSQSSRASKPTRSTIIGQGNDAKLPDGRFIRDTNGVNLCWEFNRKTNGCSATCPNKRSHHCEWCREPHRAIGPECKVKPKGWQP